MYQGIVVSFRRGKHTQRNKQVLIKIEGVGSSQEATKFIGRKVVWNSKNRTQTIGSIVDIHGRKGLVRANLRKGLSGSVLGFQIQIR